MAQYNHVRYGEGNSRSRSCLSGGVVSKDSYRKLKLFRELSLCFGLVDESNSVPGFFNFRVVLSQDGTLDLRSWKGRVRWRILIISCSVTIGLDDDSPPRPLPEQPKPHRRVQEQV